MAYYRLYFMDRLSGHIADFEEFEASSDAGAIAFAETMRRLSAMELWCGNRKIRSWPALRPAPPVQPQSARLPS